MLDQMHDSLESLEVLEAMPSDVVLPEGWLADTDRPVPLPRVSTTCVTTRGTSIVRERC